MSYYLLKGLYWFTDFKITTTIQNKNDDLFFFVSRNNRGIVSHPEVSYSLTQDSYPSTGGEQPLLTQGRVLLEPLLHQKQPTEPEEERERWQRGEPLESCVEEV